jgi:hypothetical protein
MRLRSLLIVLLTSWGGAGLASAAPPAERAWQRLQAIAGEWQATQSNGVPVEVSYRLYAGDTVLLETFGRRRPSLTAVHLDGKHLLATHYCPHGNQPRLRMTRGADAGPIVFEFHDGTNQTRGATHCRRLAFELIDADHFVRTETYRSREGEGTGSLTFTRVPADVAAAP